MRFAEAGIRDAILHPDPDIRDRALAYFTRPGTQDSSLMPLVIQAVETFGRETQGYRLIGAARSLPQTEETLAWVIQELNAEATGNYENYAYNLTTLLIETNANLLLPHQNTILQARYFSDHAEALLIERLQMLSWDFATCWQKFEEFGEDTKAQLSAKGVRLDYAELLVEALARFGSQCEEKLIPLLAQTVTNESCDPLMWLEPLTVQLAGRTKLSSAIPFIISKLMADSSDVLNEDCAEALMKIGTPAVLEAVASAFPTASDHFRIYADGALANIHTDLAVEKCVQLLARETDHAIRRNLASALLCQFASEGIEAARQLLLGRELDFSDTSLLHELLATCIITGWRFPEYDQWLADATARRAKHRQTMEALQDNPRGMVIYALKTILGPNATPVPAKKPTQQPPPRIILPPKPVTKSHTGRNDPCPCKSGKKFKNCCMRK